MIKTETIMICVCTYKRPQMLIRCLLSLAQQNVLENWVIVYVIVDNELEQSNRQVVDDFAKMANGNVSYVHQPQRGIAAARNLALDEALKQKSNWIFFFDDDQYADENAVKEAFQAAQLYQADVVSMRNRLVLQNPKQHPYFKSKIKHRDGKQLEECGTCGVLFSAFLVKPDGLGLRFDEMRALGCGEDSDFFNKAFRRGMRIVAAENAVVYEEVVSERMDVWAQCYRSYCVAANGLKFYLNKQKINGLRLCLKVLGRLASVCEIPFLLLYVIFSPAFFKHRMIRIGKKLFWVGGIVAGLLNASPELYKKVVGY